MRWVYYLSCFLLLYQCCMAVNQPHFVIVITSYNNASWCHINLASVFCQTYSNYRVIYIDDYSQDSTVERVKEFVLCAKQEHRFTLIENKERWGKMANVYRAVHSCNDTDIVVILDGDDWFKRTGVLAQIAKVYQTENVWLTYGSYEDVPDYTKPDIQGPVPLGITQTNNFRSFYGTVPGHPLTFYAGIFKRIKLKDLTYEGIFCRMTADAAMILPLCEMSAERLCFIDTVNYTHNLFNKHDQKSPLAF